jgi:hypothetical protein
VERRRLHAATVRGWSELFLLPLAFLRAKSYKRAARNTNLWGCGVNLQRHSAVSRREVLHAGLTACLIAGYARRSLGADPTSELPLITRAIPSTGERIPAIGLGSDALQTSERDAIRVEIK